MFLVRYKSKAGFLHPNATCVALSSGLCRRICGGHFLIRGYDVRMLLESASWVLTAKKMAAGSAAMEEYENILGPSKFGDS